MKKYGLSQNFDVWTQLVLGVRYLDFSIGYFPSHNGSRNFWIMNDNIRIAFIQTILHDIRRFVILSGEVVIIGFNKFPLGMYKKVEHHREFLDLLERELGDIAFRSEMINLNSKTSSYEYTINEIKKSGYTLLITYNDEFLVNGMYILVNKYKFFYFYMNMWGVLLLRFTKENERTPCQVCYF